MKTLKTITMGFILPLFMACQPNPKYEEVLVRTPSGEIETFAYKGEEFNGAECASLLNYKYNREFKRGPSGQSGNSYPKVESILPIGRSGNSKSWLNIGKGKLAYLRNTDYNGPVDCDSTE
jgi:hypothetical protein